MKAKLRQSGLSLTEMVVVIATIAVLVAVGVTAVRAFVQSLETGSSTKSMISAALFSARAIAAKEQKYAGVRFQKAYQPEGPLEAPQYMVFIIQDPNLTGTWGYGFRAVKGLKPIKLPDSVSVMDLTIVIDRNVQNPVEPNEIRIDNPLLTDAQRNNLIDEPNELNDTTTFSIVFTNSGKLVIHGVRVRNKDGETDDSSNDDIFNTIAKVNSGIGLFYQDDYFGDGFGPEPSRNRFIIYEQKEFKQAYESGQAWSGYLSGLELFYINAYMGTIIE
jgi:hypothetical protein